MKNAKMILDKDYVISDIDKRMYGSYSGGIFIFEMDPLTGLPLEGQSAYGKKLLGGNHARIEAPYIMYSPDTDYYYMFLSFGGLAANDDYIQQMFAATVGDQVVESSCDSANQLVYHVVTRTEDELYLKLVNVSAADEAMTLSLAGVPDGTAAFTRLTGDKAAVNTFTNVRVAPQQGEIAFQGGAADMILPAYSCTIVTVPLK